MEPQISWWQIGRVMAKATVLFVLCNIVFAIAQPIEALGQLSLYNRIWAGRERLPYGENPQESYNLNLSNMPAMLATHEIEEPKAADEFRVVIVGDSASWGWFLENEQSLSGQINAAGWTTADGRRIVAYNLGYPILSLTKDLLILDAAVEYDVDLVVWPVTLESLALDKQLFSPLVLQNGERLRPLINTHQLNIDPQDPALLEAEVDHTFWGQTIIGQRRPLADLLRLQVYGASWSATGIDQKIPAEIEPRRSDFDTDIGWHQFDESTTITADDLAFDVLNAGASIAMEDGRSLIIVNEPMFISDGENSDLRYNSFYPRWVYDQYRQLLAVQADGREWAYVDLWDQIPPTEFTDTPVHLTPAGSHQLAELLKPAVLEAAER